MIDLHLSAFAPRWRFLYAVRIDAYFVYWANTSSFQMIFRVGLFVRIKYTYLIEHVDIERVDDVAEKMLNIRGDKTSCDNLWNLIYGYVKASLGVFEKITSDSDRERAVIDSTESAYVMGMLVGMRFHKHKINQPASIGFETTSQKLGSESNPATTQNTPIKHCRKCGRELLDGGDAQFASTDCPFRMNGAGSSVEAV